MIIDNFFLLIITSLPVLFYVFAFKSLDEKKADLIVFIACILFVIPYLLSIILYAETYTLPWAILNFPIFQILLFISLSLKFYSLDIFNKFNGKLILKILVTLLIIFSLIRFVLSLFTVGIIAEHLGVGYVLLSIISSVALISFWVLYLIMLTEGKFMLFSTASNIAKNNLSVDNEKSKYSRDHPSNW